MKGPVTVLTGGVGGAKLVDGLYQLLPPDSVTAIVNTGDDFTHMGLHVSPDIDTLLYTLAGLANREQGWGRAGESWSCMNALRSLGGEDWFQLGDGDLALHILRTQALAAAETLSTVTARFARAWNIQAQVLPMSDDPVATWIDSDEGVLPFQHYFVARRCEPAVHAIRFADAENAVPAPGVIAAIMKAGAVLIAPSNPWLSVDPILAVPGIVTALKETAAPVVMVSPLVEGRAVKGPTAKLMAELGLEISNATIASRYGGWLRAMVVHDNDPAPEEMPVLRTNTMMPEASDRKRVAKAALKLAAEISL